jgi:hypothetical protein
MRYTQALPSKLNVDASNKRWNIFIDVVRCR